MIAPAAAIVGGVVTLWLAAAGADALVAEDYYRRGLAVNQELRRERAARERGIVLEPALGEGRLEIRLAGADPEWLDVQLVHATRAGLDQRLRAARVAPGEYRAALAPLAAGRWQLVVEDPRREWRVRRQAP